MTARLHRASIRRRRLPRRAFTLLEIIVVVTIIALLATLVVPNVIGRLGQAKHKIALSEVNTIYTQANMWMADNGFSTLPDDFELEMLTEGVNATLDPDDLIDPWDRPYMLVNPGEVNRDFDIVSFGENGEPGGEGADEDVVNN